MKIRAWSGFAPVLTLGIALLAGCPAGTGIVAAPSPSASAVILGVVPKDYFFPASVTSRQIYDVSGASYVSGSVAPASASLAVRVANWSVDHAETSEVLVSWGVTLPASTVSYFVRSDGVVVSDDGAGTVTSYGPGVFTSAGMTTMPASGSSTAMTMAYLGQESMTVPAGTFECQKFKTAQASDSGGSSWSATEWWASGPGMVKVTRNATSSGAGQTITSNVTYSLRSFTL